jgi:hypothetical protein
MPPKPRQLRAPRPKQSGNAFQALVDLPDDGSDSTFDGRGGGLRGRLHGSGRHRLKPVQRGLVREGIKFLLGSGCSVSRVHQAVNQ